MAECGQAFSISLLCLYYMRSFSFSVCVYGFCHVDFFLLNSERIRKMTFTVLSLLHGNHYLYFFLPISKWTSWMFQTGKQYTMMYGRRVIIDLWCLVFYFFMLDKVFLFCSMVSSTHSCSAIAFGFLVELIYKCSLAGHLLYCVLYTFTDFCHWHHRGVIQYGQTMTFQSIIT